MTWQLTTTGESIGSALRGHGNWVTCVAVSAERELIVSGSWDGHIRKWDAVTGDLVGSLLKTQHEEVTSLVKSSDSELIVPGHGDGTVRSWRGRTGESLGH